MPADTRREWTTAAISGHIFRGVEMDAAKQEAAERSIRDAASRLFAQHRTGYVYGSLASGSDIVLADTALDLGLEFHAILPFSIERFIELSILLGDTPDGTVRWTPRFHATLKRASTLTIIDPSDPAREHLDDRYRYAFQYVAGCALQRAALLQVPCRLVAVSDSGVAENVAGTNHALRRWTELGRKADVIGFPFNRGARPSRPDELGPMRPCIFVHATERLSGQQVKLLEAAAHAGPKPFHLESSVQDGNGRIALVMASLADALQAGGALAQLAARQDLPVRVVCDFGVALGDSLQPEAELIERLRAARDLPGLPAREFIGADRFAMQAKYELGDNIQLLPVGGIAQPDGETAHQKGGGSRPAAAPVYMMRLRNVDSAA